MTQLITRDDPRYFTCTSSGDYDRHRYRINYTTGESVEFDDWESMNVHWFQSLPNVLKNVEVLDKKSKPKGF